MKLRTLLCLTTIIFAPASLMADPATSQGANPSQGANAPAQGTAMPNSMPSQSNNMPSQSNNMPSQGMTSDMPMQSPPTSAMPVSTQSINWVTDYRTGLQQAQQNNKALFLYFTGSDWCGWCKKLDQEVFSQADFVKAMGDKFVFVKLDFPMNRTGSDAQLQQNTQLKQQYGVTGFPTVVLLDPKGNFIAETGYRSGGARSYASYIEQLMNSPQS